MHAQLCFVKMLKNNQVTFLEFQKPYDLKDRCKYEPHKTNFGFNVPTVSIATITEPIHLAAEKQFIAKELVQMQLVAPVVWQIHTGSSPTFPYSYLTFKIGTSAICWRGNNSVLNHRSNRDHSVVVEWNWIRRHLDNHHICATLQILQASSEHIQHMASSISRSFFFSHSSRRRRWTSRFLKHTVFAEFSATKKQRKHFQ